MTPSWTARARSRSRPSSRCSASASPSCRCSRCKGVAGFLFPPMAMAVVFAMVASFILSRTLVPTLALYLLKLHAEEHAALGNNMLARLQKRFENGFADIREGYRNLLALAMTRRRLFVYRFPGRGRCLHAAGALPGRGLLPQCRFRPDNPACPHPRGHPRRGHHPDRGPDRARGAPRHSQAENWPPSSTMSASTKAPPT